MTKIGKGGRAPIRTFEILSATPFVLDKIRKERA